MIFGMDKFIFFPQIVGCPPPHRKHRPNPKKNPKPRLIEINELIK